MNTTIINTNTTIISIDTEVMTRIVILMMLMVSIYALSVIVSSYLRYRETVKIIQTLTNPNIGANVVLTRMLDMVGEVLYELKQSKTMAYVSSEEKRKEIPINTIKKKIRGTLMVRSNLMKKIQVIIMAMIILVLLLIRIKTG